MAQTAQSPVYFLRDARVLTDCSPVPGPAVTQVRVPCGSVTPFPVPARDNTHYHLIYSGLSQQLLKQSPKPNLCIK